MQSSFLVPTYLPGSKSQCRPLLSPVSPPDNPTPTALILRANLSQSPSIHEANPSIQRHLDTSEHLAGCRKGSFYFKISSSAAARLSLPAKEPRGCSAQHQQPATLCCCHLILIGPTHGTADCLQSIHAGKSWLFFQATAWVLVPPPGVLSLI